MEMHKLLARQLRKFLPEGPSNDIHFQKFLNAISESYDAYERDKELSSHAFSLSEKEYHQINEELARELQTKSISIAKLKETISGIEAEPGIDFSSSDILHIVDYIQEQVDKRKEVENELRENIRRMNSLIGSLQSAILVESEERKIIYTNQTFCKLFDIPISPELMIGADCSQSADQTKHLFKDPDSFICRINELLENRITAIGDLLYLSDGRIFERDFVPVFMDNEYKGHLWNYTDITEKRRILDSVAESEKRSGLIMNSALDAIITADDEGVITSWNPQAARIFGWSYEEAVGKTMTELIIPHKFREAHERGMRHFKSTGEGPVLQKLLQLPALKKSGEEFPVELSITPIHSGDSTFFCSFIRDISERDLAQRELKVSEEKYRSIIANMHLGLLEVDNNEIIQFANQSFCEMSGFSVDELVNRHAQNLLMPIESQEILHEKKNLRELGIADVYEVAVRNKRGELKWWLISGAPRFNEKGEKIGSVGIHLDITAQKEIENELVLAREAAEHSSKAKESFLANMSHEIRTPLNGIIGFIRQLAKENLSNTQRIYVESAQHASRHLLSIINNILDISKIEAGELHIAQAPFSLKSLIKEIEALMSNQAEEKRLNLRLHIESKTSDILIGDVARLRQILINLVGNSIKFTQKGFVSLYCSCKRMSDDLQEVTFIIKDTGIGMDASFVNNVFTKFQQEDISGTRKFGGTGLGMAITKELIDLMSGKIQITSFKDVGTEIRVTLSLPYASETSLIDNNEEADISKIKGKRILLVEDSEMNRIVATKTLDPYELLITEAENGAIAVEILRNQSFDLILMDLQMPVMSGLEATKIIREEINKTIPIIALTANAFKSDLDKCLAAGMNDYVTKPFEEKEIVHAICKNLGIGALTKQLKEKVLDSIKPTPMPALHYNVNKLLEIGKNDVSFMDKMLKLFYESTSINIDAMLNAHANSDLATIKGIAHKIKPSLRNLEITSIEEQNKLLETFDPNERTQAELNELVKNVTNTLTIVLHEMKNNGHGQ